MFTYKNNSDERIEFASDLQKTIYIILSIFNKIITFVCFVKCTEDGINQERKIFRKDQALLWKGSH
jgi:hypothetical protein